ncbi:hypothetical protein [Microbacterium sp. MYb62]|uniref:hypothetical protein n=1 Tax=Microbacterium sp. MYb62 TaxID=1848690 RepID=UPI000CFC454A|nr:hypothetical protein [Microbacterium sp. MYb62]PRB10622.1 hypothetical protein CQ042_17630 [Microbacterium sp. MYb62]
MSTPTATEPTTAPRTRWAAIIWGLLFAAIAALALGQLADATRRETIADALLTTTPTTITAIILLTAGVLLLVGGAAGLIRRAQRKLAAASDDGREVPGPLAE